MTLAARFFPSFKADANRADSIGGPKRVPTYAEKVARNNCKEKIS